MVSEAPKYQRYRDPFAEVPVPKAFYHPSQQKDLSQRQKQTALSPIRGPPKEDNERSKLSVTDKQFLKGGNTLSSTTPPRVDAERSPMFEESWASSEHPSTTSVPGVDTQDLSDLTRKYLTPRDRLSDLKQTLNFSENDTVLGSKTAAVDKQQMAKDGGQTSTSVLGRYIERFRRGNPTSREERQKTTDPHDFWWLSQSGRDGGAPSDSSTPRDERSHTRLATVPRLTEEALTSLSHSGPNQSSLGQRRRVPASPSEERTRKLQERADRFLEKSISSLATTDFEVSTDGLGSSQGETTLASYDEQPYRPRFAKDLTMGSQHILKGKQRGKENIPRFDLGVPISMVTKPACPEQDILYQWRIKRKMEQARERTTFAKTTPEPNSFVPTSQTMSDVDKKLEEFKQRLAEGRLGVPVAPQTSNGTVSFTPAPRPSQHTDGKDQKKETGHRSEDSYPVIASPTLKRKDKTKFEDVEPHLHLMCDLLPCPHQSKHLKHHKNLDFDSDTSMVDVRESESETYKYLQAERPDIENLTSDPDQGVSQGHVDNIPGGELTGHAGTTSRVKGQRTEVKRKINYSKESDDEIIPSKQSDNDGNVERQKYDQTSQESRLSSQREDDHRGSKASLEPRDRQRKEQDTEMRKEPQRERREPQRERRREQGEAPSRNLPMPRRSRSPRSGRQDPVHVGSAIGQVIKDRLFNMSTSTVISSVDSLPSFISPSASLDRPVSETLPPHQTPHGGWGQTRGSSLSPTPPHPAHRDEGEEEDDDSDGEFDDDQLLQMLRSQRALYEQQLRLIDDRLAHLGQTRSTDSNR